MSETEDSNPAQEPAADADASGELLKWELWARIELDKDRNPAEIRAEMVGKGFPADGADELVSRVQARQALDFEAAAVEREEWQAAVVKYRRNMLFGAIYFAGGFAVVLRGSLDSGM